MSSEWRRANEPARGRRRDGYWNGETDRERMVRELMESRGRVGMALAVNIILSVAILLLAIAFVWISAALGATE